jgi:aspartate carbamoyltransferase catalytic subunit
MLQQKRHINSINDLENSEIEEIFRLADEYSSSMSDPDTRYQVRGRRTDAGSFILATLFYEPSTRTRFSFESAMIRLGGSILASSDPTTTSASKGESLADTVRVIENYADLIVLRHPWEGAARAAAEYANIPIINGGDGSHEHPTQTLCDLYTLRQENKSIRDLNVLLVGDLKNGRTVHSLVYALARFGANIFTMPAEGLELPLEVSTRLEREFQCVPMPADEAEALLGANGKRPPIGAVYVASPEGQQFTLLHDLNVRSAERKLKKRIDVCYVTRPQKERLLDDSILTEYPIVNKEFLEGKQYHDARVLHPLPRVSELAYELDHDPRGVYFKQAGYGVPVRMALIAKVLGISPFKSLRLKTGNGREIYVHDGDKTLCLNEKCISHNHAEKNLPKKFIVIDKQPLRLRCLYCETSVSVRVIADKRKRTYAQQNYLESHPDFKKVGLFSTQEQAREAGFEPAEQRQRHHV